jgi:hypothetical protein
MSQDVRDRLNEDGELTRCSCGRTYRLQVAVEVERKF